MPLPKKRDQSTWRKRYETALRESLDARKKLNYFINIQDRCASLAEANMVWSVEKIERDKARALVLKTVTQLGKIISERPAGTRSTHRLGKGTYTTKI